MTPELQKEFSQRLLAGESQKIIWSEIELFYVIRQTFYLLDPGKISDYAPDEYDHYAAFVLGFLAQFAETGLSISHPDLEDLALTWMPREFKGVDPEVARDFAYELYCELFTWREETIYVKGKPLPLLREEPKVY